MKKIITGVLLCLCSFFFFGDFVSAKSEPGVVITDLQNYGKSPLPDDFNGYIFNYFYEERLNTPFYSYLSSSTSINYSDYQFVSIYSQDEICYLEEKNDQSKTICNRMIETDSKYAILGFKWSSAQCGTFGGTSDKLSLIDTGNSLKFSYDGADCGYNSIYYYLFDNNGVQKANSLISSTYETRYLLHFYIESYEFSYEWYDSPWYKFWEKDSYLGSDFGSFYSKVFYLNSSQKLFSSSTINLYTMIDHGADIGDSYNTNSYLDYFVEFPIVSSSYRVRSLQYIYDDYLISSKIPINHRSINMKDNLGVLFIPKKSSALTSLDYRLYITSNNNSSAVILHTTTDLENFSQWSKSQMGSRVNEVGYLDMYYSYEKLSSIDTTSAIYFEGLSLKYDYIIYYDSDAYDVVGFGTDTNSAIHYLDVYISYDDFMNKLNSYYAEWGDNNLTGVSCGINEKWNGTECVHLTSDDDALVYDKDGNLIEANSDKNLVLGDILDGAWDGIKGFVSSSYTILSMSTHLFNALPPEISSLLTFTFTIGVIILIWKLFH